MAESVKPGAGPFVASVEMSQRGLVDGDGDAEVAKENQVMPDVAPAVAESDPTQQIGKLSHAIDGSPDQPQPQEK